MINLSPGGKIYVQSTQALNYTLTGVINEGITEKPGILAQSTIVANTTKLLYTAREPVVVSNLTLRNTSGSTATVSIFVNGVLPANQIFSASLSTLYTLTLDATGWKIYDNTGLQVAASGSAIRIEDSAGNALSSTGGSLDVNVTSILSPLIPVFATRSDTYITTGSGVVVDVSSSPVKYYAIQVNKTGSVTSWDVRLEGSLDGVNFTPILTHTEDLGNGEVIYIGTLTASNLYFRSRCEALVLGGGTNIVVTILGTV